MLEKKVEVDYQPDLINELQKKFSPWSFKDMGRLNKYPNSRHFHITSKQKSETGTLEITFLPKLIILKVTSNRKGNWAESAMLQLEKSLYEA